MSSTKKDFTLRVYRLSKENNQSSLYLGTDSIRSHNGFETVFPNIKSYEGLSEAQLSKAIKIIHRYRGDENGLFKMLEKTLFD